MAVYDQKSILNFFDDGLHPLDLTSAFSVLKYKLFAFNNYNLLMHSFK